MSDNENVPLSIFCSNGLSRPFGGSFKVSMEHDIAVIRHRDAIISAMTREMYNVVTVLCRKCDRLR